MLHTAKLSWQFSALMKVNLHVVGLDSLMFYMETVWSVTSTLALYTTVSRRNRRKTSSKSQNALPRFHTNAKLYNTAQLQAKKQPWKLKRLPSIPYFLRWSRHKCGKLIQTFERALGKTYDSAKQWPAWTDRFERARSNRWSPTYIIHKRKLLIQ